MSVDRSITGRSGYSDEENAIIDGYMGLESKDITHNLRQHLAARDYQIRTLEDKLRRSVEDVEELRATIEHMNEDFKRTTTKPEECEHDYRLVAWCSNRKHNGGIRPETEPSDGWVENPGRKACPVPGDFEVEVEFRSGLAVVGVARDYRLEIDNNNWGIVKYRIIK
ncbi:TPA_asm: hypothetical protein GI614_22630 [Salmonella enterica subsp. enterica serovar Enteritidis]|uniref:Uncharacterized protein n=1 Tax=Salmonella enteritidis TaxID=149539 RepID=A0A6X7C6E6_SALEN|nr:hypothetical protein [Salmonella enterica subsp. enterica serovar Enteritidis]